MRKVLMLFGVHLVSHVMVLCSQRSGFGLILIIVFLYLSIHLFIILFQKSQLFTSVEISTEPIVRQTSQKTSLSHTDRCEHLPCNRESFQVLWLIQIRSPRSMTVDFKNQHWLHVVGLKVRINCVNRQSILGLIVSIVIIVVLHDKN